MSIYKNIQGINIKSHFSGSKNISIPGTMKIKSKNKIGNANKNIGSYIAEKIQNVESKINYESKDKL